MTLVEAILAAFVVLMFMVPIMLQADPPPVHDTEKKQQELKMQTESGFVILLKMPPINLTSGEIEPKWGRSLLDRLIRERYAKPDNAEYLWELMPSAFYEDPGTLVTLDTGNFPHFRHLFGERYGDPIGERVSVTKFITPKWNAVYAETGTEPLDGLVRGDWTVAPVNASRLMRLPGQALRFNATFEALVGSQDSAQSYSVTGQGPGAPPTINLDWDYVAGAQTRPASIASRDVPENDLFFKLVIGSTRSLSAGIVITVRSERGIASVEDYLSTDWTPLGPAVTLPDGGSQLSWEYNPSDPSALTSTLNFRADLAADAPGFVRVHAWLSNGALARTTALVKYTPGRVDAGMPREILPTVSYALQPGDVARVSAVLVNGAEPVTVRSFRVDAPGGYDFKASDGQPVAFFTGTPVGVLPEEGYSLPCEDGTPGGWSLEAASSALVWCGRLDLAAFQAETFVVNAEIAEVNSTRHRTSTQGTAFASGQLAYWEPTIEFPNGHVAYTVDGPGAWQRAPGLSRYRVPAASALDPDGGYPVPGAGGSLGENDGLLVRAPRTPFADMVGPAHPGATFELGASVASADQLSGAVQNASASPRARTFRAGEALLVDADFRGVMRHVRGLSGVTNLKRAFEVYSPASLPGLPFLRVESDVASTPPLAIRHLAAGDLVAGGGHELAVAAADGYAYALNPLAPDGAPSTWSARVTSTSTGEAHRVIVGDVTTAVAGVETLASSVDGDVRLLSGTAGAVVWSAVDVGSRVHDLAWAPLATDGMIPGRVLALVEDADTREPTVVALNPTTGATVARWSASATEGVGGHLARASAGPAAGERVVVALPTGSVRAYTVSGALVGTYSAGDQVEGVLGVASGEYDGNPLNGDEVVVAFGNRVLLLANDMAFRASWTSPTPAGGSQVKGVLASMSATTTGTSGPEIAWAGEDDIIRYLDMSVAANGGDPLLWESTAPSRPDPATALPKAVYLETPSPECYHSDLGDSLTCLASALGAAPLLPGNVELPSARVTALAIVANADPPGALVVLGGISEGSTYLMALDAATGTTAAGWTERAFPGEAGAFPTAIAVVPKNALPAPDPPWIAVGTNDGSVYLRSWSGTDAWDPPASPSAPAGTFTYEFETAPGMLLGTYVLRALVTWDKSGVHQEARVIDWAEGLDEQGWSADDPYAFPVHATTWQGEWDR